MTSKPDIGFADACCKQALTLRRRNSVIISAEPIAQQVSGIAIQIHAFL
jgi:hypothetical protein